jgi:hypothetical protein
VISIKKTQELPMKWTPGHDHELIADYARRFSIPAALHGIAKPYVSKEAHRGESKDQQQSRSQVKQIPETAIR